MVMGISRKDKTDQFWSYLYGICPYNKQSTSYRSTAGREYAWCCNRASGHDYTMTVPEWDALELEHRKVNTEDVWAEVVIERSAGKLISSQGDPKGIELLRKGLPTRKWQVGLYEALEFD
jgi:hypothetical protein